MNDKVRAWVDARICQHCGRSRIPVESDGGQPVIDCTCGRSAARKPEVERRHRDSTRAAAKPPARPAPTDAQLEASWLDRMRAKGYLA